MMNKVGRVKRISVSFLLILIIIPILLNFIPIKFAMKLDKAQEQLENGRYICITESKYVLDTSWIAKAYINTHLEEDVAVRVSKNSPNKYLSDKEFDFKWFEMENKFLLIGTVDHLEENKETNVFYANLNVDKWKIIYPVERTSIRKYFTPKSYLNIYDYDLMKVIKYMWSK